MTHRFDGPACFFLSDYDVNPPHPPFYRADFLPPASRNPPFVTVCALFSPPPSPPPLQTLFLYIPRLFFVLFLLPLLDARPFFPKSCSFFTHFPVLPCSTFCKNLCCGLYLPYLSFLRGSASSFPSLIQNPLKTSFSEFVSFFSNSLFFFSFSFFSPPELFRQFFSVYLL